MSTTYDSTEDTVKHIHRVQDFMSHVAGKLSVRALNHDASKLESPEKEYFDEFTPMLAELTYGTDEYRQTLRQMKPALEHHYAHNSHHPEYYENGIDGMSLLDLIEMLCDWRAASERTKQRFDGDDYLKRSFEEGLEYNKERWGISDQLYHVLVNTAKELDFI